MLSLLVCLLLLLSHPLRTKPLLGQEGEVETIARGGGTTIIQGGTGAPNFTPVVTKIAFHAEQTAGGVGGSFDCLATMPAAQTGTGSGQVNTVNAMYVTGTVTSANVMGDTATLSGTATITGLGAGSNVPFTVVVRKGGPGATVVLKVNTLPNPFREVLLEGAFQIHSGD